jgi:hypothetical protein
MKLFDDETGSTGAATILLDSFRLWLAFIALLV